MKSLFTLTAIGSIAAAVGLMAVPASAVVIDDHFDDGDITTNTTGTGTGFNVTKANPDEGSVGESGSIANVNAGIGFGNQVAITSKDTLDPSAPLEFNFAGTSNDGRRFRILIHQDSTAPIIGTTSDYLNLEFDTQSLGGLDLETSTAQNVGDDSNEGGTTHESISNLNAGSFSLANAFDVSLDLSETGYNIVISQGGSDAISWDETWGGNFALSKITNNSGESYVTVHAQSTNGDQMTLDLDRVAAVPEPASLVLLGLGGLMLLPRRKPSRS